jgi:hypothetical protein
VASRSIEDRSIPAEGKPMSAKRQLPHVSAPKAMEVALQAVSTVQQYTPGEQVAGIVVLAYLMCQQCGIDVSEAFNQAQRRYDTADTYHRREAQALNDYVNGELR